MIEKKINYNNSINVVLVAVIQNGQQEEEVKEFLDELEFLAETAGGVTVKTFTQKLDHPDSRTFVGKGKLQEIKDFTQRKKVDLVIFDDELTGSQISNIEKELNVTTIDRSDLILDIFASRAKTAQAKVQVELAQYQYILPRLKGMWKHLERQGAGIGSRGPGETEIETDRRIVKDKISLLRKRLAEIDKQSFTQRKDRGEFIRVALVGYTNVGKSTIMNVLSKSDVFAENKLFATLDTTTRKVVLGHTPFLSGKRLAGSFSRQRQTTVSKPVAPRPIGGIRSMAMRSATSVMVGAANGCRPTVSSYSTTPSDQMSARASPIAPSAAPRGTCTTASPGPVVSRQLGTPGSSSAALEMPKSSTFIAATRRSRGAGRGSPA